jgi:4-hydroxy-4-methyl-2-oxoglutarate aldolase
MNAPLTHADFLQLKRWNTPTIYNGWEQITRHDASRHGFNIKPTHDFMPQMGPMVGRAVTVVCEPSNATHPKNNPQAWSEYRRYVASIPGPKIVVVQDLDQPHAVGAFWGEVNSNIPRSLGCVGTIIDGAIRDVDEMNNAGFKALARRLAGDYLRDLDRLAPSSEAQITFADLVARWIETTQHALEKALSPAA